MSDPFVYPGMTVLYRPTASDVLGSGEAHATEDGLYPLIISSINWKKDKNGDHTEAGFSSVNGVVIIEGVPLIVKNVPYGNYQGSFTDINRFNEPAVIEPRPDVVSGSVGRGAPVEPPNANIPMGLAALKDNQAGQGIVAPVAPPISGTGTVSNQGDL